ncbi:MAG: peptidase M10, partial [Chitinophagales bacterium]|nr:peptidase M10 [Chitinophagales bacterium]
MYPRGTLVNPEFQYDVNAIPAQNGGTLYPIHRRVMQIDIDNLQLKNKIENDIFVIGKFSNKFHEAHIKEA